MTKKTLNKYLTVICMLPFHSPVGEQLWNNSETTFSTFAHITKYIMKKGIQLSTEMERGKVE